jgi:hypothetical protein
MWLHQVLIQGLFVSALTSLWKHHREQTDDFNLGTSAHGLQGKHYDLIYRKGSLECLQVQMLENFIVLLLFENSRPSIL